MAIYHLNYRCVIKVSGKDAGGFLQGIISNDIESVNESTNIYALMLTPQGKILYDFFIYNHEEGYFLDIDKEYAEEIILKLKMYKLRSDVVIEKTDNLNVYFDDSDGSKEKKDPRGWGSRFITSTELKASDIGNYHEQRIVKLIPEYNKDIKPGEFFTHHLGMDDIGAISYTKGCYVGQEVVARSKYKIKDIKKKLYSAISDTNLPYGEEVFWR